VSLGRCEHRGGHTNLGAATTANGTYTLTIGATAARGQQVVLTARYIGHKPVTRTVTLTAGEQHKTSSSLPIRSDWTRWS